MKARSIIASSLVVTTLIGVLNSIVKNNRLPSFRFFFGTGILYLFLTMLADFEEEIAKTLSLAIVTFVVIGEGGGVLDHFLGKGTSGTTLDTTPATTKTPAPTGGTTMTTSVTPNSTRRNTGINATIPIGHVPIKPGAVSIPTLINHPLGG